MNICNETSCSKPTSGIEGLPVFLTDKMGNMHVSPTYSSCYLSSRFLYEFLVT